MAEKKKNNKYVKIITRIIGLLSVIISIIFIGMMFYSNIIPNKFLYPAMIFILIFTILCTILIFKNKAKIVLSVILLITSSLCLLGSNYFYQTINMKYAIMISISFCFLYACTDEIHQLFVVGRTGRFTDVLIDTCGSFTGIMLSYIIGRVGRGRKDGRKKEK